MWIASVYVAGIFDVMFLLTVLIALPVLFLTAADHMLSLEWKARRGLTWAAVLCLGALALLVGGNWLLGQFGLAWRNLPAGILGAVALISGICGAFLTVGCTMRRNDGDTRAWLSGLWKGGVLAVALTVSFYAAVFGTMWIVFGCCGEERVLEYQGQTLLEVDDSFLDPIYHYYEYHGPLVRGGESLYGSLPARIDGDTT